VVFSPVANRIHVHDLRATIFYLFGLDPLRPTYRFQGREGQLTDVAGKVVIAAHRVARHARTKPWIVHDDRREEHLKPSSSR